MDKNFLLSVGKEQIWSNYEGMLCEITSLLHTQEKIKHSRPQNKITVYLSLNNLNNNLKLFYFEHQKSLIQHFFDYTMISTCTHTFLCWESELKY